MTTLDYLIIAIYLVVVIGIGFFFSRKKETTENYLLGGRNMPYFAIGLSCTMSLLSSISIVMVPGEIYNHGLTLFVFAPTLIPLVQIPYYLLFTRFYFKLGSFTPYEYLEYRYDAKVRALISITAFYSRIIYLGMVLYSTSKIFSGAYHWSPVFTIVLVGLVGVLYTVLGGMKAVVWTDVIQFFVLFGGLAITVVVLCSGINGGAVEAVTATFREGHGLAQFSQPDFYGLSPYVRLLFFLLLWNALIEPLTMACSDQINIQRLLCTKDWQAGLKSQVVATVSGLISRLSLYFIGMALFTYYLQNPDPALDKIGGDSIFFHFISTKLPAPIPGLFMAAMLAAIMSSIDSGMNSMATVWLKEIHVKFINRTLNDEQEVKISRWATLLVGFFAIALGLALELSGRWLSQSVAEVGTIFYLLGAATLPAFLFAVLSRRANAALIWGYTFFAFGEGLSKNLWYVLSRSATQAWEKDPSLPLGWGGPLDGIYVWLPLVTGTALCLPWLFRRMRLNLPVRAAALFGLLALGFALGMGMWFYFSNTMITDVPLARSFAFFLPVSFLGAFAILWFCPLQPEEKYRGLTLGTLGDPVVAKSLEVK
ncbi:MAG: sodium/solute symporter [Victivallaceae bacterium]